MVTRIFRSLTPPPNTVTATYDLGNGNSLGLAVDPTGNQLFITGSQDYNSGYEVLVFDTVSEYGYRNNRFNLPSGNQEGNIAASKYTGLRH